MGKWAFKNPLAVILSVVLLFVALGSAADSYRQRQLVKQLQVNLEDQAVAKERELEEAEQSWLRILNASDAKLGPVLRERDALRKKLAAAVGTPFVAPGSAAEIVDRWQQLGYPVRVAPCR